MTEIKTIENLLSQVNTIRKSYEKVAKATGENFNVFSILGLERSEVKAHSAFIAHLLNAQGKHGFGHAFLDAFVSIIKTKNFESPDNNKEAQDSFDYNFKTVNSYAKKEHYIGNVKISEDLSKSVGGSIDILIRERPATNKVIMIENKIDAGDQPNQLLRYHNAFPKGLLIYLTLDGKISSEALSKKIPYKCISYKEDIVIWLEECQKIAIDNPVVRETIKQYKNLIKKLTDQNINTDMNADILNLITNKGKKQNFECLINLVNLKNEIYKIAMLKHLYPTLETLSNKHNLRVTLNDEKVINKNGDWLKIPIENHIMNENNIRIRFSFNMKKGVNNLIFGFEYIDIKMKDKFDYKNLKTNFENHFPGNRIEREGWPALQYYNEFKNWEDLNVLKEVIHGDFKTDFTNKIETLLKIADTSF